jgi:lipoate-protein ligase A
MARDETLARGLGERGAREGGGEAERAVLRLYGWSGPTISLGRNEPTSPLAARALRSASTESELPLDVVRRPTGGRAVLHDAEVTYAVAAPYRAFGGPRDTYRRVNEALAAALASLGANVSVADPPDVRAAGARALPLDAGPCFQSPAPGEVVAAGRTLVGSAQARIGGALLQHGSIIIRGDQSRLAELDPAAATATPPATLEELIGPVTFDEVADALEEAVLEALGGDAGGAPVRASSWSEEERARAAALVEEKYGRPEWTWRR